MKAYDVKLRLKGVKPITWRDLIIPAGIKFNKLHKIIQETFGFLDCHSYRFSIGDSQIGKTRVIDEYFDDVKWVDYEYDFGDGWEVRVEIKKIIADYDKNYATLKRYKGDYNPIDDCGGVHGFMDLIKKTKKHDKKLKKLKEDKKLEGRNIDKFFKIFGKGEDLYYNIREAYDDGSLENKLGELFDDELRYLDKDVDPYDFDDLILSKIDSEYIQYCLESIKVTKKDKIKDDGLGGLKEIENKLNREALEDEFLLNLDNDITSLDDFDMESALNDFSRESSLDDFGMESNDPVLKLGTPFSLENLSDSELEEHMLRTVLVSSLMDSFVNEEFADFFANLAILCERFPDFAFDFLKTLSVFLLLDDSVILKDDADYIFGVLDVEENIKTYSLNNLDLGNDKDYDEFGDYLFTTLFSENTPLEEIVKKAKIQLLDEEYDDALKTCEDSKFKNNSEIVELKEFILKIKEKNKNKEKSNILDNFARLFLKDI